MYFHYSFKSFIFISIAFIILELTNFLGKFLHQIKHKTAFRPAI